MPAVVIVGAGQAGYQMAASLRQAGFDGSITLVNGEPGLPYQRPPLSKGYLLGTMDEKRILLRQEGWYAEHDITLVSDRATAIDRAQHSVTLQSGASLAYDHLVLAPGAVNRRLSVPGADLDKVFAVRTRADVDSLAPWVRPGARVVVVGAGFIGLEFASVALKYGASVTVVEVADRPLARAVSVPTSSSVRTTHERAGMQFVFGRGLTRIVGRDKRVSGVLIDEDQHLDADLVVYGIGVQPETGLAAAAGLKIDNGIRVDDRLATVDPAISAIGDAVSFPCTQLGGVHTRLESVQNAVDQARCLADILTGGDAHYAALPWFWSDQGDIKLQIAGLATEHDRWIDVSSGGASEKVVLRFDGDTLTAVETINRPGEHMLARRLLTREPELTPAAAAASGFDLKTWHEGRAILRGA